MSGVAFLIVIEYKISKKQKGRLYFRICYMI